MSKTILCVDDSVTMQRVAEITFEATDYNCVGARNADDGLAAAKNNRPALILADAVMPGKTGYDLCQSIKDDPDLRGVPVLIMCGNSQAYDPNRGESVGADGHVIKPWDTQVMLDKISEVLETSAGGPSVAPTAVPASGSGASARPPAPAPRPPAPPPAARPPAPPMPRSMPSMDEVEPPRSATIMGMPSIKLPGPEFGIATPIAPTPSAPPPPPRPVLAPTPAPVAKAPPIAPPKPMAPIIAPLAPPVVAPAHAAPLAAAIPAAARPAPSRPIPTMPRPPMIKGTPSRRPSLAAVGGGAAAAALAPEPRMSAPEPIPQPIPDPRSSPTPSAAISALAAARTSARAADVAAAAGIDPNGAEMAAIVRLSREVVEQVVWEVVPELAESIIREHIAKNGIPSGVR